MANTIGGFCMRDYQQCSLEAMQDSQKPQLPPPIVTSRPRISASRPQDFRPVEVPLHQPGVHLGTPTYGLSHSTHLVQPTSGILSHVPDHRARPDNSISPECEQMGIDTNFGSFGGRPANSVADCTWDFFGCTRRKGRWPANKPCCQARFNACCDHVMGTPSQSLGSPSSSNLGQGSSGGYGPIQQVETTPTTTTTTITTTTPTTTTTTTTTRKPTFATPSQRPGFDRDGNPVRM
eukprot:maker-scaffold591_size129331-snap-gene-0.17 protein:Tk08229 transcript:maker-scaffold591_size129331-snap-gene-0.17-mRNA-1 annotation:"---NA---"